jgi:hypothetical protein
MERPQDVQAPNTDGRLRNLRGNHDNRDQECRARIDVRKD